MEKPHAKSAKDAKGKNIFNLGVLRVLGVRHL